MEKFIPIALALLLTVVVIDRVIGAERDTFEVSGEVIREEYYDVFAEHIDTREEVQLACSSKCVQVGEDCSRFYYRAEQKLCTVTKLRREKSGGGVAPVTRYFHNKCVQGEKQVSAEPIYSYTCTLPRAHVKCGSERRWVCFRKATGCPYSGESPRL